MDNKEHGGNLNYLYSNTDRSQITIQITNCKSILIQIIHLFYTYNMGIEK